MLESMKKNQSINSFCVVNLMLLLSSVQYNQTFSTTPAGNSRQFYPRPRYSREHCTGSHNYRGFHIFVNPVPAGIRGFGPIPMPVQNSNLEVPWTASSIWGTPYLRILWRWKLHPHKLHFSNTKNRNKEEHLESTDFLRGKSGSDVESVSGVWIHMNSEI